MEELEEKLKCRIYKNLLSMGVFTIFVLTFLAWKHSRKLERRLNWERMDMCGDKWEDRRGTSFTIYISRRTKGELNHWTSTKRRSQSHLNVGAAHIT